jgi:hypothetical protein
MSRSGYTDDYDDAVAGLWRGHVKSAIRGKRGQAFLRELATAMDAMPEKILIAEELINEDGDCCTVGVVCKARSIDVSKIDYDDPESVGRAVGIAHQMAAEIEYENDEGGGRFEQVDVPEKKGQFHPGWEWREVQETPAERWVRMRKWVSEHLKD